MSVKLVLLKTGETLISDIKEGLVEDRLVCYVLENPCTWTINGSYKVISDGDGEIQEDNGNQVSVSLSRWPSFSDQNRVEIALDSISTIVEPIMGLKKLYETQVLGIDTENEQSQIDSSIEQSDSGLTD